MGNCCPIPNPLTNQYYRMDDLSESLLDNSQYQNNINVRMQVQEQKLNSLNDQLIRIHQNMRLEAAKTTEKLDTLDKAFGKLETDHGILIQNDAVLMKAYKVLSKLRSEANEYENLIPQPNDSPFMSDSILAESTI